MQTPHNEIVVTSASGSPKVREFAASHPRMEGSWGPFRIMLLLTAMLTLYVIKPFWSALFLSGALAVASYPLYTRLTRLLRGRAPLAGLLMTGALFTFLIAPLASIVTIAVSEVTAGLAWIQDKLGIDSLRDLSLSSLPPSVDEYLSRATTFLHITRADLREYAAQALDYVQAAAPGILSTSVNAAGLTFFVLVAYYFLLVDGRQVATWTYRLSPLPHAQTHELFDEFRSVSSSAILGTVATSMLIGALVAIGFIAAGIPHAVFFGLFTVIAGFIPIIGSALVWLPACAILALTSHVGASIGLFSWCTVGVAIADNVVKPMMMRGKGELHLGLMLLSLIGGLAVLGGIGIIAGPVIVAFMMALLRIYVRDYIASPLASSTPSPASEQRTM